jgi:hypothetical protein
VFGIGGKKVQLASEDELAQDYPDFELGAAQPFGGRQDRVIVDERLAGRDWVVLEARLVQQVGAAEGGRPCAPGERSGGRHHQGRAERRLDRGSDRRSTLALVRSP